jgi:hypothetical protein
VLRTTLIAAALAAALAGTAAAQQPVTLKLVLADTFRLAVLVLFPALTLWLPQALK